MQPFCYHPKSIHIVYKSFSYTLSILFGYFLPSLLGFNCSNFLLPFYPLVNQPSPYNIHLIQTVFQIVLPCFLFPILCLPHYPPIHYSLQIPIIPTASLNYVIPLVIALKSSNFHFHKLRCISSLPLFLNFPLIPSLVGCFYFTC